MFNTLLCIVYNIALLLGLPSLQTHKLLLLIYHGTSNNTKE